MRMARAIASEQSHTPGWTSVFGSKSRIFNAATDYHHIDGCPKCPFFQGFIIWWRQGAIALRAKLGFGDAERTQAALHGIL